MKSTMQKLEEELEQHRTACIFRHEIVWGCIIGFVLAWAVLK